MRFGVPCTLFFVAACTAAAPATSNRLVWLASVEPERAEAGARGGDDTDAGDAGGAPRDAAAKAKLRVLFIGNSLTATNNLPDVLAKLGQAPESVASFDVGEHTVGGASWAEHAADPVVDAKIKQGWDYVVLQDQSSRPWFQVAGLAPGLLSLDAKVHAAGAKTALFMTWPQNVPSLTFQQSLAVNNYYERHADAVGALLAPVGRAFERVMRDKSVSLYADGIHPNARGTYLAACSIYETLTGASPVGLSSDGGLVLPAGDAPRLQAAAWETRRVHAVAASPAVGVWPLSGAPMAHDFVPSSGLVLGDLAGADGGAALGAQLGTANRYGAIPYVPGLNVPRGTVVLYAYRGDWSAPTATPEVLLAKPWAYELRQSGTTLEARAHTDRGTSTLATSVASLAPGWHQLAFSVDGNAHSLWVDASLAASGPAAGFLRYTMPPGMPWPPAQNDTRFSAIALGVDVVDTATSPTEPGAAFLGGLGTVRLFDRPLAAVELASLAP